ncbi:MAG: DMT family transporter [Cycloclasticus sp.]
MSNTLKAVLLLNIAGLFWGGNMILGHYLKDYFGPWSIVSTRLLIGGAIFLILLIKSGELKKIRDITNWRIIIALAITGVIAFQFLIYYGLRLTTSTNGGLINSLTPLLTAIVVGIYFKEKLTYQHWLAAMVTVLGLAFILSEGQLSNLMVLEFNLGDLFILAAVCSWVAYSIIAKVAMRELTPLLITSLGVLISLVVVVPLGLWETQYVQEPTLTLQSMLAVLFISTGPTVLSLLFWNKGVLLIGPARASLFLNTVPVYIIVINALFLDVMPQQYQLVGMLLIFAGSFYAGFKTSKPT